jgi:hypothetical protein
MILRSQQSWQSRVNLASLGHLLTMPSGDADSTRLLPAVDNDGPP